MHRIPAPAAQTAAAAALLLLALGPPLLPATARAAQEPAAAQASTSAPLAGVPTPESVFGFRPGEDGKLNAWADVTDYFKKLDAASDRVRVENLGKTTEGKPFLLAVISAPENLKDLDTYREINHALTDPRRLKRGDREAEELIRRGKTIVVVTCGVHSTEVASYLSGQLIAYRLASATDGETTRILRETIILLVPSLNPDGVDIVKNWYDRTGVRAAAAATGGTGGEEGGEGGGGGGANGLGMPLYQKYVGHDDNRDWVGFTQAESKLTVDRVLGPWRPQILHDIHQQGAFGPRIFLPPYTLPVEPNIPQRVVDGYTRLGTAIAADLTAKGFTGVITGSDSGAGYDAWSPLRQYAHFHNSVRILSETASANLASPITVPADRVRPNTALPNFPKPWPGGTWRVGDATRYATAAAFALLNHAATHREEWLRDTYALAKDSLRPRAPGERAAFLLPPAPNRAPLLTILHRAGVELAYLDEPARVGDREYPKGTAVVRVDQPYGAFASAVLTAQQYPDILDAAGQPIRPYDVTAHTLPLLFDTPVAAVNAPFTARATASRRSPGENPVRVAERPDVGRVRLGVLQSNSMDEGWTRWVLEQNGVPYTLVDPADFRDAARLRERYDALLLPTALPRGGGGSAADAVKQFAENGGTVIAVNRASASVVAALDLPVRDVTAGLARTAFYVPGSILRTELDTAHPLARGLPPLSVAWAENSPAFEVSDPAQADRVRVVARYPSSGSPLLSGWLLGGDTLRGKAALVEVRAGKGRAVLFGFKPNYRGLSLATYPLLFNAIATSAPAAATER